MPNTGNGVSTNGDPPGGPEALASEDLEHALARRATPRARALRWALVVPIILVAGAVLLRSAWPLIVSRTPPSILAPTPSVPVAVTSDVSFGSLYLNGRRLHGPPPQMVTLRQGTNTLRLSAPPFPTQTCTVIGPIPVLGAEPARTSGQLVSSGEDASNGAACQVGDSTNDLGSTTYTISLTVSGDELSPALQAGARAAVVQALAVRPPLTATVPTGEYFATGSDQAGVPIDARASAPLTATLTFAPQAPPGFNPGINNCASMLCGGVTLDPAQPATASVWEVAIPVVLDWRFTTSAGRPVAAFTIPTPTTVPVALTFAGGRWVVAAGAPGSPSLDFSSALDPCGQADDILSRVGGAALQGTSCAPSPNGPMGGCAIDAVNADGSTAGRFIYRFGALLAADAAAHRLVPALPIAPPAEVAAVAAATAG